MSSTHQTVEDIISQRAAVRAKTYGKLVRRNQVVGALRWAIPILAAVAVAILAVQVLLGNISVPFGVTSISVRDDAIIIGTPRYEGVLEDGTAYSVEANGASIDVQQSDLFDLENVKLNTVDPIGYRMSSLADQAQLNLTTGTVQINEEMFLRDSDDIYGLFRDVNIDWPEQSLVASSASFLKFPNGSRIDSPSLTYDLSAASWQFNRPVYLSESPTSIDEIEVAARLGVVTQEPANDDANLIRIVSSELVFDAIETFATFSGDALLTQEDLRVSADRFEVDLAGFGSDQPFSSFEGVGSFVLEDGNQTVRGEKGVFDPNTSNFTVTGSVEVETVSGTVSAPLLVHNIESGESEFGNANGRVSADFQSTDPVNISADDFEIGKDENIATFSGNVRVKQSAQDITASRVIVHFTPGSDQIAFYEAIGGVRVLSSNQDAKGNRARYNPSTRMLALSGNVRVLTGGSEVSADNLVVNLATNVSSFTANRPPSDITEVGTPTDSGRVTGVFETTE